MCCPIGNFCHGVVDYGLGGNDIGSGDGSGSWTGNGNVGPPPETGQANALLGDFVGIRAENDGPVTTMNVGAENQDGSCAK